jgi:hypothetical protein
MESERSKCPPEDCPQCYAWPTQVTNRTIQRLELGSGSVGSAGMHGAAPRRHGSFCKQAALGCAAAAPQNPTSRVHDGPDENELARARLTPRVPGALRDHRLGLEWIGMTFSTSSRLPVSAR